MITGTNLLARELLLASLAILDLFIVYGSHLGYHTSLICRQSLKRIAKLVT